MKITWKANGIISTMVIVGWIIMQEDSLISVEQIK